MPNFLDGLINSITATPNPDFRDGTLALLDLELERAQNEVFGTASAFAPSEHYIQAFNAAMHQREIADNKLWLSHEQLDLPLHWLTLLGFRFCAERGLFIGGLIETHIRAAEVLNLSPGETRQWDVDLLFQVYVNTRLRAEWTYEGLHFRFENAAD